MLFKTLRLTFFISLCNTVCSTKQWSPELDPVRLQILQTNAQEKIEARDAQALEMKHACYPTTRPPGWAPTTQPLIETDVEGDDIHDDDEDNDHYNAYDPERQQTFPPLSQQFEHHLQQTEATNHTGLEVLFGQTKCNQLIARSELLKQRRPRGRPRKADKSSSGGRLPSGQMSQQVNGFTLDRHANGPTKSALKGITERCGTLITPQTLVSHNLIPGRIQVYTKLS